MLKVALLEHFSSDMRSRLSELAGEGLELVFCASDSEADRAAILRDVGYAVVRGVKMPSSLLDAAPDLKMIHQWGTGTDGIPVKDALSRGIVIARSPGRNAPSVADLTVGLMLSCQRRICVADARIRAGEWAEPDLYEIGRDLTGTRVGLVGYGAIARQVEKRLRGFDCDIVHSRASGGAGSMDFHEMVASVDILSLHAPATPETRHLIDAECISRMRPGTVLINTARGDLVDETALADALMSGQIGAAGIDAFATEPLPAASPLRNAPNTVFTAHAGGRTRDNFERMVRHWAGNIRAHAQGRAIDPQDLVG